MKKQMVFSIAHAMTHGYTIITHEKPSGGKPKKRVTIRDAAASHRGVTLTLYEFLQQTLMINFSLQKRPGYCAGFSFASPSSHTPFKKPPQPRFSYRLCDASHKINSFCYQIFNIKTQSSNSNKIYIINNNSYYHHVATTQRYDNPPDVHCCDDRQSIRSLNFSRLRECEG
ncbi:hypothetical protein ACLBOM_25450 [Escherichia coli]